MITRSQATQRLDRLEEKIPQAVDIAPVMSPAEYEADLRLFVGAEEAELVMREFSLQSGPPIDYRLLSLPALKTLERYFVAKGCE